jgi:multiple sugar transport system permease protein
MFIPNMAIMTTSFIVVTKLHMINTLSVLIIPGAAQAYAMFFIRQFYLNVPAALEETALIDGSSRFGTYRYIFLPMSLPPFVIIGIGAFLGYWNNYVWPTMTVNNPDLFQVMQYLGNYRSMHGSELGLLMAGSTLAAIPIICLVLFFQRYIIQGIIISGMK